MDNKQLQNWIEEQSEKILAMFLFDTDNDRARAKEAFSILKIRAENLSKRKKK